ncbi:hypothetical protein L249_8285, partial [Ophiocordyceps polyrhachis-furcata BCC 54312]
RIVSRAVVLRREMGDSAVAGTVVGIVIFLLALCLYPIIVGQVKRRRRERLDAESGRPSSIDSHRNHVELHPAATKEWNWSRRSQQASSSSSSSSSPSPSSPTLNHEGVCLAQPSDGRNHHAGQGMSADYYNASIPSEQSLGVTAPSSYPHVHAVPSVSGTFKDRIKRLLRQGTGYADHGEGPQLASRSGPAVAIWKTSVVQPWPSQHLTHEMSRSPSSSPPAYPAPGTVNPMDIMPASTEVEVWHRKEQELLAYSHGGPPLGSPSPPDKDAEVVSLADHVDDSGTAETVSPPLDHVDGNLDHADDLANLPAALQRPPAVIFNQAAIPAQQRPLTGGDAPPRIYHSDQSTPFNPSLPNTAVLPDSPRDGWLTSSDSRSSNSPQSPNTLTRAYCCDEPGCTQTFNQLHKLRHHQRYHSKAYKCTYNACERAFGTKTHLERHINERHEQRRRFHCPIPHCIYHKATGRGFSRRDNWRRHMMSKHGTAQDYSPIIVDTIDE